MNWSAFLLCGFVGTAVLSVLTALGQATGVTRLDFPFILGTIFTPDRDRARVLGYLLHFLNGWFFAAGYVALFETTRVCSWWFGAVIGLIHGAAVLTILLPILPGIHPRMVSDSRGPQPTRLLEPPGFLGSNYGSRTAIALLLCHVVYGIAIGSLYAIR